MARHATTPPSRNPPASGPRGALVFLGLATTLAIIDATIVNVALPSISADIGLTLTAGEWVVSGYGLTLASLLISFGRLVDRLGQRPPSRQRPEDGHPRRSGR